MREAPFHHLIKKYSNRKLYDTQTRRYITLDDIARMVRDGGDVTVVQRDTGEDLTPAILSQIVAREERRGSGNGHADLGDGIQERGQALLDYLRRTINMPAEIVSGEVERRVGDMESLVDNALERALKRLNIPTRRDIVRLNARLDAIDGRLGRSSVPGSSVKRATTRRPRQSATAKSRTRKGAA
ncbi:MAG TPA: polyhydroxyalkanoate synthesis regulator DNA-binding domain-containing protein [Candidatus Dormibacteraeota bacterium]|nr:polyhydroxyalkanoate synthesis regulator DNA-binding domain-containing protein [Candidatus Dormibacteraeota bacterium]